jgi:hypothetical protein
MGEKPTVVDSSWRNTSRKIGGLGANLLNTTKKSRHGFKNHFQRPWSRSKAMTNGQNSQLQQKRLAYIPIKSQVQIS